MKTLAGSRPEATITAPLPADSPAGAVPHSRARFANVAAQTGRTLWSLLTWPIDWLHDFFGVESMDGRAIEAGIVDGTICDRCGWHEGERCPMDGAPA